MFQRSKLFLCLLKQTGILGKPYSLLSPCTHTSVPPPTHSTSLHVSHCKPLLSLYHPLSQHLFLHPHTLPSINTPIPPSTQLFLHPHTRPSINTPIPPSTQLTRPSTTPIPPHTTIPPPTHPSLHNTPIPPSTQLIPLSTQLSLHPHTHYPSINTPIPPPTQPWTTDPPERPGKPEVKDRDRTFIELKWEPPKNDGGSPITGYEVERKEPKSNRWMKVSKTPVLVRTFSGSRIIDVIFHSHILSPLMCVCVWQIVVMVLLMTVLFFYLIYINTVLISPQSSMKYFH